MLRLELNPDFLLQRLQKINIDNDDLDLHEEVQMYFEHPCDLEAGHFNCYWLKGLDEFMPYRLVHLMIERMERSRRMGLSEYAEFRDCEDFILHSEWFEDLELQTKQYIRKDFYGTIILGIRNAFDRKRAWKLKNE